MDENRYPVETNGYTRALCAELHELQMKGVACDVSLLAEDGEISAHKIVLMAGSMYFYRCLTFYSAWKDTSKLVLPGIIIIGSYKTFQSQVSEAKFSSLSSRRVHCHLKKGDRQALRKTAKNEIEIKKRHKSKQTA